MERCYVVVWKLENSEEAGIEYVTLSLTQAERICLDLEAENPGKIYYWIPSFLEPNI
jgi:hypothetical protein